MSARIYLEKRSNLVEFLHLLFNVHIVDDAIIIGDPSAVRSAVDQRTRVRIEPLGQLFVILQNVQNSLFHVLHVSRPFLFGRCRGHGEQTLVVAKVVLVQTSVVTFDGITIDLESFDLDGAVRRRIETASWMMPGRLMHHA